MQLSELIKEPVNAANFKLLFTLMRRHAITQLSFEFSGSGDDGNMNDDPTVVGLHESVMLESIACDASVSEYRGTQYPPNGEPYKKYEGAPVINLRELSYKMAWVVLENDQHDWVNNDGGYGEIIFEITQEGNNSVFCDMNINISSSEAVGESIEFDDATGEVIDG